jgi:dTMP kinase
MTLAATNPTGRLITLEGLDGAGKSTQHARLVEHLRARGLTVVATREPGGTPLGEKLRALLLSEPMHLETEALLMFAARREHIAQLIAPALARGEWVVCDRFTDASMAYQGGGRGLSMDKLRQLASWVHPDLQADLTLIFDAPVELAMARVQAGTTAPDRFEREQAQFFTAVRGAYLDLARTQPARVRLIDATRTPESITADVIKLVEQSLLTI